MPPTDPTILCNGFANCGQMPLLPLILIPLIAGLALLLLHRFRPKGGWAP